MSTKDLFNKSNKVLTKSQEQKIKKDLESPELAKDVVKSNNKFHSHIDFSNPENFSFYGSAQKYYEDSFNRIYQTYPYDGSKSEKEKWFYDSSELDLWILDNAYPKFTGYVNLNPNQTILVKGGPNNQPGIEPGDREELSKQFPVKQGNSNIWDTSIYRNSNLYLDASLGNTVEFWVKASEDMETTVFSISNNDGTPNGNSAEFSFTCSTDSGEMFIVYKDDAGTGLLNAPITIPGIISSSWNHLAISLINVGNDVQLELYKNGERVHKSIVADSKLGVISQEHLSLTIGSSDAGILSLDEFRFWKRRRTEEEIGRYWHTQIHGGTNTDEKKYTLDNRKVDIGIYYKFNEGITGDEDIDSIVLDCSGRISNAQIINYNSSVRSTASAFDESGYFEVKEDEDPVIYSSHPDFISVKETYMREGLNYDYTNNSSIYHTMPSWIIEEDEERGENVKELSQVISSYFDSAQIKIKELVNLKDVDYHTLEERTNKPYSLIRRTLESAGMVVPDLFTEASAFEEILSRGEQEKFEEKLQDVKNTIYQNIYNNLSYIYKSKGTEKAFRNLIRCFGIDDELVKINLYSDGADYTLEDSRRTTAIKKKFIDFNNADRESGVVYSNQDNNNLNSVSYLKGVEQGRDTNLSFTFETEVIFPKRISPDNPNYQPPLNSEEYIAFVGEYDVEKESTNEQYAKDNNKLFDIRAVKENDEPTSENVRFVLEFGGQELSTKIFKSVYDNSKWNIAVRLVSKRSLHIDVEGDDDIGYDVELYCVSMLADSIEDEDIKSFSITRAEAKELLAKDKFVSIGALHTNGNPEVGTSEKDTRLKISSTLFWYDNITNEEIQAHGSDASNFGRLHPNDYILTGSNPSARVLKRDTLALHWDFSEVATTNSSGEFVVDDLSGSLSRVSKDINENSISFDGAGDFVEVGDHEVFSFATEDATEDKPFSVSAWVFRSGAQGVFLAKNSGNNNPSDWFFGHTNGEIQVRIYDGTGSNGRSLSMDSQAGALPLNEWHLVTFTYDGSQTTGGINIYLDNSLLPSTPTEPAQYTGRIDTGSPLRIGANAANGVGNEFESNIADCYVFDKEITLEEVAELYNDAEVKDLQNFSAYDNTISWWRMGDALDTESANGIRDYVGGFHGTLTGEASIVSSPDLASEVVTTFDRYGWFASLIGYEITGRGKWFLEDDKQVVNREFIYSAKHRAPEVINSEDLVEIRTQDDLTFTKDAQIITHFFAAEKSMYQVISDDMINLFATIVEFNNLIGQPVNRYRIQYKALEKFRARYFEKVKNVPSLEKYVELYKWIDSSIGLMLRELIPVSSNFSADLRNMIESHVLERNKYWTKFPTMEMSAEPPLGIVKSINELTYNWKHGHAPIGTETIEKEKVLWGDERVGGTESLVSTGNDDIDKNREILRRVSTRTTEGNSKVVERGGKFVEEDKPVLRTSPSSTGDTGEVYSGQAYVTRALAKPYKLNLDIAPTIHGGTNYSPTTKDPNSFVRASTKFSQQSGIEVTFGTNPVIYRGFSHDEQSVKRTINIVIEDELVNLFADGDLIYPFYETVADPTPEITNHHNDSYGDDSEIPVQGTFTETWVGGNQHRHIHYGVQSDRPELFIDENGTLVHPFSATPSQPAARYTRDELAKRPINIRNIKTGESKVLGNYARDYEVVQTSSRTKNNRWFVKNEGVISDSFTSSPFVEGLTDFELPDRTTDSRGEVFGKSKHVFVERFSAPGDSLTLSRGHLDRIAEEFSVYNSMNYRNFENRMNQRDNLTAHTSYYNGSLGYVHDTNGLANIHKVNRNTAHDANGKNYDNAYVKHQIPRSDFQYNTEMLSELRYYRGVDADGNEIKVGVEDREQFIAFEQGTTSQTFSTKDKVAQVSGSLENPVTPGMGFNYKVINFGDKIHSKTWVWFGVEEGDGNLLGEHFYFQYKVGDERWIAHETFEHNIGYSFENANNGYYALLDYGQSIHNPLQLRWVAKVRQQTDDGTNHDDSTGHWEIKDVFVNPTSIRKYLTKDSVETVKGSGDYADYQGAGYRFIRNSENTQVIENRKNNIYSQLSRDVSAADRVLTYVEPAVVWNKPNTHYILNERYDNLVRAGTEAPSEAESEVRLRARRQNIRKNSNPISYSYSNNLEVFSNSDLTRALDMNRFPATQFADALMAMFKRADLLFSRSIAREVIFPKHKNVGLKKTRTRGYFDSYKFFWKDKMFDRIKCSNTTKLGYEMTPEFQKLFNQKYSVDVMDNFHYNQKIDAGHATFTAAGNNTFIEIPDNPSLSNPDGFSISMWFNPSHVPNGTTMLYKVSEYYINATANGFTVHLRNNSPATNNIELDYAYTHTLDSWQNLVLSYDGGLNQDAVSFYVDGVLLTTNDTDAITSEMDDMPTNLYIGSGNNGQFGYKGSLRDVVLFNRALTNEEVTEIKNLESSLTLMLSFSSDIISYWKLHEDAMDYFGNNHGSVNNVTFTSSTFTESYQVVGDLTYMGEDRMRHMITRKDVNPLHTGSDTEYHGLEDICVIEPPIEGIVPRYSSDEIQSDKYSPIPTPQLYHNPYSDEYKESQGWINRKPIISGQKATYNDYDSFSEEIRLAAQNYGLVSEFRISEHMDKYILENGGNFRAKNYDFLTLDGASHDGEFHTLSSGTAVKETSSFYSLRRGDASFEVTDYPTSLIDAQSSYIRNNADGFFGWNDIFSPSGGSKFSSTFDVSNSINTSIDIEKGQIPGTNEILPYASGINAAGKFNLEPDNDTDYLLLSVNQFDSDSTSTRRIDYTDAITLSIWVQPEENEEEYNMILADTNMNSQSGFDKNFILYSKFNSPGSISRYQNLGLTLVFSDDTSDIESLDSGVFAFFEPDGTSANLTQSVFNHIAIQFVPPVSDNTPYFVKLWLNGRQMYGMHLIDTLTANPRGGNNPSRRAYSPCPVGLYQNGSSPWGDTSANSDIKKIGNNIGVSSDGTLSENDKNMQAISLGMITHDFNGQPAVSHKLIGLADELVLFKGLLPSDSIERIYNNGKPNNVGELHANGFIGDNTLDGNTDSGQFDLYTSTVTFSQDFEGNDIVIGAVPDGFTTNSPNVGQALDASNNPIGPSVIKSSSGASNQLFALNGNLEEITDGSENEPNNTRFRWIQRTLTKEEWGYNIVSISFRVHEGTGAGDVYNLDSPEQSEDLHFQYKFTKDTKWEDLKIYSATTSGQDLSEEQLVRIENPNFQEIEIRWVAFSGDTANHLNDHWAIDDIKISTPPKGVKFLNIGTEPESPLYTFTDNYSVEIQSQMKTILPVWQRIGVASYDTVRTSYNEWNDEFFNSYVHTDNLTFIEKADDKHDSLSVDTKEVVKLKVNAIKKLLPYEGFYPQDRTVQLSNLFVEKISSDIMHGEKIYKNQAVQAALQHFFAPGILYNSIKAGIACDWASYTNDRGTEPSYFGEEIITYTSSTGAEPSLKYNNAIAPSWYGGNSGNLEVMADSPPDNPSVCHDSMWQSNAFNTGNTNADGNELYTIPNLFINKTPNKRLPFEAILDPYRFLVDGKSQEYRELPHSNEMVRRKSNQHYLMLPSYYTGFAEVEVDKDAEPEDCPNFIDDAYIFSSTGGYRNYNYPYFELKNNLKNKDFRYELAINNFISEATAFFINNSKLSSFASTVPQAGGYYMQSSKTYFMDIALEKSQGFSIVNSPNDEGGRYFGPPVKYVSDFRNSPNAPLSSPAYSVYTPPYFYGSRVARISFTPEADRKYTLDEIFNGSSVEEISPDMDELFSARAFDIDSLSETPTNLAFIGSPAYEARMPITASIELFGKTKLSRQEYDASGNATSISTPNNEELDTWVIYTKFECPLFDFSSDSNISDEGTLSTLGITKETTETVVSQNRKYEVSYLDTENEERFTTDKRTGSGIWAGYGSQQDSSGVTIRIQESFPKNRDPSVGSLMDVCGFVPQSKQVGRVADSKEISEAVVMIPFLDKPLLEDVVVGLAGTREVYSTVQVDDRNFIKVNSGEYHEQMRKFVRGEPIYTSDRDQAVMSTSITKMIEGMSKYNIPPLYDFNQYSEQPFAMYFFEFKHTLDREDLSNIWQGVQPKIAKEASLDSVEISHEINRHELFGNLGEIPKGVRWMVFKVKKKAEKSYYNLTEDSRDDTRFKFKFDIGLKQPEYGYNYPYDYFTMLELIQVEANAEKEIDPLQQYRKATGEES